MVGKPPPVTRPATDLDKRRFSSLADLPAAREAGAKVAPETMSRILAVVC